jgi:hypothetical protein
MPDLREDTDDQSPAGHPHEGTASRAVVGDLDWWVARLLDHHGDYNQVIQHQLIHLSGEVGEAVHAYQALVGSNPRRPSPDLSALRPFRDELLDVIVTAAILWRACNEGSSRDPLRMAADHLTKTRVRQDEFDNKGGRFDG